MKDSFHHNKVRYLYYAALIGLLVLCAFGIFFVRLEPNALSMDIATKGTDIYTLQYKSGQGFQAGTTTQTTIDSPPKSGTVNWFGIPFPELQGFTISFDNPEKRTIITRIQVQHEFHRIGISLPLYSWTSHQFLDAFAPVHDVNATIFDLEDRFLHITSTGNRVAIIYQGSLDGLRREISQHIYLWKLLLLLITVIILGGIFLWTSRNDEKIPKPSLAFIGLILLLFAALAMNGYLFIKNPNFGGDAGRYIFPAYNFMHGKGHTMDGIVQFYPPGYGFTTYFVSLLIPDLQKAAMLVSSVAYLLSIVVAFYFGKFLAGEMGAFLSALFWATCPYILRYSYTTLTESLYIFLVLLSFFVYLKILHEPPTYLRSSLFGILLGLTYCVREEAFLIFVGSISLWGIFLLRSPKRGFYLKKRMYTLSYPLCAFLFGAMLIAIPVGHLYYQTGHLSISGRLYMGFGQPSVKQGLQEELEELSETRIYQTDDNGTVPNFFTYLSQSSKNLTTSLHTAWGILSGFLTYLSQSSKNLTTSLHTAWGHTWKIILHAMLPFVCIVLWLLGYIGRRIFRKDPERKKRYNILQFIKTGMAFWVFISPLFVLILWGYMRFRHVMQHVALVLPIFAVIITTSLNVLPRKQRCIGFLGICILSLATASGVIEHVPFVKERLFFPEYMLTKDSMQIFKESVRDDQMPDEYIPALKSAKWQKFTDKKLLFQTIEAELEHEIPLVLKRDILKASLLSPFRSYAFLPKVFTEQHTSITLKRAAQWLRDNAQKPLKDLKIMARKGNIILFYAERRTKPPRGEMVSLLDRTDQPLSFFAQIMRQQQVDYLVVNFLVFPFQKALKQLWEDPALADDVGLVLEYENRDDELGVQIYSLSKNDTQ